MGMVFLGEHRLLGRRAAIKTLLPTVSANHEVVERFFNEARATSAITDPGVIQIFDFGYHVDGTAYIVMELLEGEALSARIERLGRLTLGEALRIARQLAGSLSAAHACDIVHRDLKPENVFLVADSEAQGGERTKILDFGICKIGAGITGSAASLCALAASDFTGGDVAVTQTGAMVGTPVYMSPEQCRGAGGIDHRSDIYAFGCLVFHMITGRPPFVGEASGDLVVAHLQSKPPAASEYVPGLPHEIDALLLRCLAKSPADRYQSMAELQLALGDIYVQLDASEAVAAVTAAAAAGPAAAAMPLGSGFRSVYDANLTAALVRASHVLGATRQLRFSSTPPWSPPRDRDHEDSTELAVAIGSHRRSPGVRALFACVLVAGVVLGLVATTYTRNLDLDGARGVTAARAAELHVEPAASPPLPPVAAPAAPAVEPAIAAAAPGASPTTEVAEPDRDDLAAAADAPAAAPASSVESRTRSVRDGKSPLKSARARSRALAAASSPVTRPSTRAVSTPAAPSGSSSGAFSPAPALVASPPSGSSPPSEDLYDTR